MELLNFQAKVEEPIPEAANEEKAAEPAKETTEDAKPEEMPAEETAA